MNHVRCLAASALLALAGTATAQSSNDVFPFPYEITDLDNGLRVVTVTTEYPGIVAVHCVVSVGSRHEVEEGKTGFAHFFEHMMFRGTETMSSEQQAAAFKAMGADRNAYTSDDITNYHTVVPTEEIENVLRLEADRFQRLSYSEKAFRTEAMAILGEYNKNSANPTSRLLEKVRETAFDAHTYSHTTMGYLRDISAMPRQMGYSKTFFDRFYRPEYVTLVVVGDVAHDDVLRMAREHWGSWQRGDYVAEIPNEPEQQEPRECHVEWPSPTQPWVVVCYKTPSFSTDSNELASLQLGAEMAFGGNSDLYRKLFVEDAIVDSFFHWFPDRADPGLGYVFARVKDPADWSEVRDRILGAVETLRSTPVDADTLRATKTRQRYGFAASLDSSSAVADELAGYIALARTPEAVNAVYRQYDSVTPASIQNAADKWLVPNHRTIATLSHEPLPEAGPPQAIASDDGIDENVLFLESSSPLLAVRVAFPIGAADELPGERGLANLTARMLTESGTAQREYAQILEAFYPIASGVSAQTDKEMTVFGGVVHKDNARAWLELFGEMMTEPGFREEDFERIKASAISSLEVDLKANDDEELGKEVLYREIYGEKSPYGSPNRGVREDLESFTLDDVRRFARRWYFAAAPHAIVGIAGNADPSFVRDLTQTVRSMAKSADPDNTVPTDPWSGGYNPIDLKHNRMTIVEKNTLATGLHIGFPISVTRFHQDWVALWLIRSWLGEHRSSNSHLYQRLREVRGLNYGDYAYIEYFPNGGRQFKPDPNLGRFSQIFQIWIRPVPHQNGPFALKAAWYELDKLIRDGLSEQEFEETRDFLTRSVALGSQNDDRRLGHAIDSRFYRNDEFVKFVRDGLAKLTVDEVNRVLRTHLRSNRLQFVVVTNDGEAFKESLLSAAATPISYQTPPADDVLEEDKLIEVIDLNLREQDITIVPLEQVFAK
jgi:zinc protease